jgi:hypothetical protein
MFSQSMRKEIFEDNKGKRIFYLELQAKMKFWGKSIGIKIFLV